MRRKSIISILILVFILSISLIVGATTNDINIVETNHKHSENEDILQNEKTKQFEVSQSDITCECGGTFIGSVETSEMNWYTDKYIQCNYNTSKTDTIEYRNITTYYTCNKCKITYDTTTQEYRDNCSYGIKS